MLKRNFAVVDSLPQTAPFSLLQGHCFLFLEIIASHCQYVLHDNDCFHWLLISANKIKLK